jgi:hypothetical protein
MNMCLQSEIEQFEINPTNFVKEIFYFELQALCTCLMAKVITIMVPFLSFSSIYNVNKVHNMLALMLDLQCQSLDMVKTFVRKAKMII